MIGRLAAAIEAKARVELSNRLAPIANAPSGVIHLLAFDDDIAVAEPVLLHSPRLDDSALVANANSKSQRHLFAISQRQRLSEAVTDILVQRGDRLVVHSVAKNAGAKYIVIVGENEVASDTYSVKELATGTQESVARAELAAYPSEKSSARTH